MPQGPRTKNGANSPPAPPTIEQFLDEWTFRGIALPVTHAETSFSQSTVEHKPVDRDGAFIESTGRDPYTVSLTVMFSNHILPTKDATWQYGNLYPVQYNKFLNACRDRKVGILKHAAWGQFDAKITDYRDTLDPQNRSGAQVQVTFKETIPPTFDSVAVAIDATAAAVSYDRSITALPPNLKPKEEPPSFQDMINGIKGAIDGTALKITQAIAQMDRVLYNIDRVGDSLKGFKDNATTDVEIKGERLYESVLKMRRNLNQSFASKILTYRVPRDMSTVALVQKLGNDVPTLLQLNPSLIGMRGALVPEGTFIRYERLIG